MIFLTSYIWDLNIFRSCGNDVREPTLHLCGEYLASHKWLGLLCRNSRGVAQPGSAHGWGPCGRWFKSSHPDQGKYIPDLL